MMKPDLAVVRPLPGAFDDFLKVAWDEHGNDPKGVANRLAATLHVVDTAKHIPPFARLLMHVFGEHLGDWQRGISLLESVRRLPAFDGSAHVARSLALNIATLRYASGDSAALESLALEDRVSALAKAAAVLAGRREFRQALTAYFEALYLAREGLPSGSPAVRALAVGGNNLAAALEEKTDRDASETRGMIAAAQGGLKYWKEAGTWLEEERAEYRLTRSLLQAGRSATAIQSAKRCIHVCEQNNAPPLEQFFGHAALACAHRAAGDAMAFEASRAEALRLLERVPEDGRRSCDTELKELGD